MPRTPQSVNINVKGFTFTLSWDGFRATVSTTVGPVPEGLIERLLSTINRWSRKAFFVPSPIAMFSLPRVSIKPQRSRDDIVNSLENPLVPGEELLLALPAIDSNLEDYVGGYLEELFKVKKIGVKVIPPDTVEMYSRVRKGRTTLMASEGGGVNRAAVLFTVLGLAGRGSTILVEEAETNLHPQAQYKLAKILAKIAREELKQLVVATHSEHILPGILNSIAGGELSLDDIAVYYMSKSEDGEGNVEKLEVNEHGRVKGGLPGFFEAEIEELLDMLAPKGVTAG